MAKFIVTALSFIDNRLVQPGEEIDFDGEPGPNLQAVDKQAQKAAAAAPSPAVAQLITAVRVHAASRGVSPDDVNEIDFDEVLRNSDPKPADDVVKAAAQQLNVTLGQSLA